tara:strand:- start:723 stop:935 length:213 start_codon:yes stop_codon:yes gene_type:complete
MGLDEILEEAKTLENEQKALKAELFKMAWAMRGGVTTDEVFGLCYEDREIIASIVKENIEVTKKSGLPYF